MNLSRTCLVRQTNLTHSLPTPPPEHKSPKPANHPPARRLQASTRFDPLRRASTPFRPDDPFGPCQRPANVDELPNVAATSIRLSMSPPDARNDPAAPATNL